MTFHCRLKSRDPPKSPGNSHSQVIWVYHIVMEMIHQTHSTSSVSLECDISVVKNKTNGFYRPQTFRHVMLGDSIPFGRRGLRSSLGQRRLRWNVWNEMQWTNESKALFQPHNSYKPLGLHPPFKRGAPINWDAGRELLNNYHLGKGSNLVVTCRMKCTGVT